MLRIPDLTRLAALVLALLAAFPAAADERLAIASYNVQFVTPEVPLLGRLLREIPGHKPNVAARAEAIGRALACFDLIALQETVNDRRRGELFAALSAMARAAASLRGLPRARCSHG